MCEQVCEYVEGVYANTCSVCTCEQAWVWCVHVNVCGGEIMCVL